MAMVQRSQVKRSMSLTSESNRTDKDSSMDHAQETRHSSRKRAKAMGHEGFHNWSLSHSYDLGAFPMLNEDIIQKDVLGIRLSALALPTNTTLEIDPFVNKLELPANPSNAPGFKSGSRAEIGLCGNDSGDDMSQKFERLSLNRLGNIAEKECSSSRSVVGGSSITREPPQTPKPSFLSNIEVYLPQISENCRPSTTTQSFGVQKDENSALASWCHTLPLQSSTVPIRGVDPLAMAQKQRNYPAKRIKCSWKRRNAIPWRTPPHSLPSQNHEPLSIPLRDQGMSFPAPIPTMDKLPLRRGLVGISSRRHKDLYAQRKDNLRASAQTKQSAIRKALWTTWYQIFEERLLETLKSIVNGLLSSPDRQLLPVCLTLVVGAVTSNSVNYRCSQYSQGSGEKNLPYILQVKLVLPAIIIHGIPKILVVIRRHLSSRLMIILVTFLRVLVLLPTIWLLSLLDIEVATELRGI